MSFWGFLTFWWCSTFKTLKHWFHDSSKMLFKHVRMFKTMILVYEPVFFSFPIFRTQISIFAPAAAVPLGGLASEQCALPGYDAKRCRLCGSEGPRPQRRKNFRKKTCTMGGPPFDSVQLPYKRLNSMVFGRYNYSMHGVYKPLLTGGHHPVNYGYLDGKRMGKLRDTTGYGWGLMKIAGC